MDYPRFERIEAQHDRLHLAYHGGKAVELVLRLVDVWLIRRPRAPVESTVLAAARPEAQTHILATSGQHGANHA